MQRDTLIQMRNILYAGFNSPKFLSCIFCIWICHQSAVFSQVSHEDAIARLAAGRDRITSGEFSAVERFPEAGDPSTEFCKRTIYCAFDVVEDRFRFDYVQNTMSITAGNDGVISESPAVQVSVESKYIRLSDRCVQYTSLGRYTVWVRERDSVFIASKLFHPDCVGLATRGDRSGFPDLAAILGSFSKQEVGPTSLTDAGELKLEWLFANGMYKRELWLDTYRDFVPTRMLVSQANTLNSDEWLPVVEIRTEWQTFRDNWVPKRSQSLKRRGSEEVINYEIEFDWKRLNDALEPSIFSVDGFGLKQFAQIVDTRLSVPVVVGRILPGAPVIPTQDLHHPSGTRQGRLVLWFNAILILIGLTVYCIRKRKSRSRG